MKPTIENQPNISPSFISTKNLFKTRTQVPHTNSTPRIQRKRFNKTTTGNVFVENPPLKQGTTFQPKGQHRLRKSPTTPGDSLTIPWPWFMTRPRLLAEPETHLFPGPIGEFSHFRVKGWFLGSAVAFRSRCRSTFAQARSGLTFSHGAGNEPGCPNANGQGCGLVFDENVRWFYNMVEKKWWKMNRVML